MTRVLVLDDSAAVNDLFARVLRAELDVDVVALASIAQAETALADGEVFDIALVDLSFPEEKRTGLEALLAIHAALPDTILAVITQADSYVAQLLRDVWELLPIATVISKAAPINYQLDQVRQLVEHGSAPIDPSVQPLLPESKASSRDLDSFRRLIPHIGHAKIWAALLNSEENVTYRQIADIADLRLNTVRNYRADLLPELKNHGLSDPSLREMRALAWRCRPLFERLIDESMDRHRGHPGEVD